MKAKKAIVALGCAGLLVAGSVAGTLAYLTDTESVTNTFTVGNVAITLDEAKVNEDGTVVEGADRVENNKYHLLPGHEYTKDPTIHVAEKSEESYIFVKLTIEDNADLKVLLNQYGLSDDLWDVLIGSQQNDWNTMGMDIGVNDGSGKYLLAYQNTVTGQDTGEGTVDIKLFDKIKVPGEFTNEDLAKLDKFKITVDAYAVQADGFGDAKSAWEATFGKETVTEETTTEATTED